MKKKIFLKIVLILSLIIITWFIYSEYFKEDKSKLSKPVNSTSEIEEDAVYNSNITQGVILLCTVDRLFQDFKIEGNELTNFQNKFLERVEKFYTLFDK